VSFTGSTKLFLLDRYYGKIRNSLQCRMSGEECELGLGIDHSHLKLKLFVGLDQCF